jgi:hypothetical protein
MSMEIWTEHSHIILLALYIYLRKKKILVYKEPENTRTATEGYFACP